MSLSSDTRGVSEVLGAIMVFALVLTVLVIVQVAGVPAANQQIEFEHNARVQGDFQEFDRSVDQMAATGAGASVTVESGVRYPPRLFLINPGPAAGTVSTGPVSPVSLGNVEALNGETDDFFQTAPAYETTSLSYAPAYNQYTSAPTTRYENGVLYNTDGSGTSVFDRGNVVSGNRIALTLLEGDLSSSSTRSVAVPTSAVSAPSQTVSIRSPDSNPVTLELETELSKNAVIGHVLRGQFQADGGHVIKNEVSCTGPDDDGPCGILTIPLESGQTYELRMSKIGVGSGYTPENPAYLTKIGSSSPSIQPGGTDLTVEVRDQFHTAKGGQAVSFEITSGSASFVGSSTVDTDEFGRASVTVNPSGDDLISVRAFYDPNENGILDSGEDSAEFVAEYTGLPVADNANEPVGDLKDINPQDDVYVTAASFETGTVPPQGGGGRDMLRATFQNDGDSDWTFTEARISFVLATHDPTEAIVTWTDEGEVVEDSLSVRGQFEPLNDGVVIGKIGGTSTLEFDFDAYIESSSGSQNSGTPFDGLVIVTFKAENTPGETVYLTYFLTD